MKKVEIYSNWCYIDQLDGKPLKNGEKLRLRWPNGTTTRATVILEESSYSMMDHGSPCDIPVSKAYVAIDYKGVKAMVRLCQEDILCERI